MEYVCSIVMGVFAAATLLYAGLMALTKDYKILPYRVRQSVKPKNPEKYTVQLSKVIALVSSAPALGALAGLWNTLAAVIVLIVGIVVCINKTRATPKRGRPCFFYTCKRAVKSYPIAESYRIFRSAASSRKEQSPFGYRP